VTRNEMRETALHRAVVCPASFECVRVLIKYGAIPYVKDAQGKTPEDRAMESGNVAVCAILSPLNCCYEAVCAFARVTRTKDVLCKDVRSVICNLIWKGRADSAWKKPAQLRSQIFTK
jgi:hypothetical protein